jgi:hypothetical protein
MVGASILLAVVIVVAGCGGAGSASSQHPAPRSSAPVPSTSAPAAKTDADRAAAAKVAHQFFVLVDGICATQKPQSELPVAAAEQTLRDSSSSTRAKVQAEDILEIDIKGEYSALAAPVPPQSVAAGYNSIFLADYRVLVKAVELTDRQGHALAAGRPPPLTKAEGRRFLHQLTHAVPALVDYGSQHHLRHCIAGLGSGSVST